MNSSRCPPGAIVLRMASAGVPTNPFRREDLLRRHHLVVARGEQEHRAPHLGKIYPLAECDEPAGSQPILLEQLLDHLQVIRAGQIDGPGVPVAEASLQSFERGRIDSVGRLQKMVNGLPVEFSGAPKIAGRAARGSGPGRCRPAP
jgi:hypothetical protein